MRKFLSSALCAVNVVVLLAACKPLKSASDLQAIVGTDNGQEKALAIVGMRNNVELKNVDASTDSGKLLLESIYEQYFGLVECSTTTVGGKKIGADAWMNLLEFYSFSGVLYLDRDRRIVVYKDGSDKNNMEYFPCGVISAQLLTAPQLLKAPAQMDTFPTYDSEPKLDKEQLKETFLVVQSIYLALRGPHKEGVEFPRSLMASVIAMSSQSYPSVAISDNSLAAAMASSDPFYNPCSSTKVDNRAYLQTWRDENYDCVPSSVEPGIKNFRPSARTGYANVRQKIQMGLTSLSAATKADADAAPVSQARRVLRSTQSWLEIQGADAAMARQFAGMTNSSSKTAMMLAGTASSDVFRLPETGAISTDPAFSAPEVGGSKKFSLAGATNDDEQVALVNVLSELFQGSRYWPNFTQTPLSAVTVADRGDVMRVAGAFEKAQLELDSRFTQVKNEAREHNRADILARLDGDYTRAHAELRQAYRKAVEDVSLAIDPNSAQREGNIIRARDASGQLEFIRGQSIGSGAETVRVAGYAGARKVGNLTYNQWVDLTAPQDHSGYGIGRQLYRVAGGDTGGQVLKTTSGDFVSSWRAKSPGAGVGTFYVSESDAKQNQGIIATMHQRVNSSVAAGAKQSTNWGNFTSSMSAVGQAMNASNTLYQVGSYVKSDAKTYSVESANQKALREQGWKAAGQAWDSGKKAVWDATLPAWGIASKVLSAGQGATKPSNTSATPPAVPAAPAAKPSGSSSGSGGGKSGERMMP